MVSVSQVPALTTTHQVQSQSQQSTGTVLVQQTGGNIIQSPAQRNDNAKEKCRKFLTNLIDLSKREPATVEMNVKTLIQELVDAKVGPEDFCKKLENLLNAAPQPCLVGFLKVWNNEDLSEVAWNDVFLVEKITEKSSAPPAIVSNKRNHYRGHQPTKSECCVFGSNNYNSTNSSELGSWKHRGKSLDKYLLLGPNTSNRPDCDVYWQYRTNTDTNGAAGHTADWTNNDSTDDTTNYSNFCSCDATTHHHQGTNDDRTD